MCVANQELFPRSEAAKTINDLADAGFDGQEASLLGDYPGLVRKLTVKKLNQ